jgi:hypothetical protein
MKTNEWNAFLSFRDRFLGKINEWEKESKKSAIKLPFVFNKALCKIEKGDTTIKYILIGDNPGKKEQESKTYFDENGQAGKAMRKFFNDHKKELGIEHFEKNVIILNKTPIHTVKTKDLGQLKEKEKSIFEETQRWMAKETACLHQSLDPECKLWIIGLGNLNNKIFNTYRETFQNAYSGKEAWEKVFVYKHFSTNWFTRDYKNHFQEFSQEKLENLGKKYQIAKFKS